MHFFAFLYAADKLKRMFGSTGGSGGSDSRKPLVYDPGYATLDPVPHNTSTHTTFTPQISQAYKAAQFAGEEGIPAGASKSEWPNHFNFIRGYP